MEATRSSELSVHTRTTRRHISEDGILHGHRCENVKFYTVNTLYSEGKVPVRVQWTSIFRQSVYANTNTYFMLTYVTRDVGNGPYVLVDTYLQVTPRLQRRDSSIEGMFLMKFAMAFFSSTRMSGFSL
jgi:hypothetical protein